MDTWQGGQGTLDIHPPRRAWYQPVLDAYGVRLGLVFGNVSPGGRCPYYAADSCNHCDMGAGEGDTGSAVINVRRMRWYTVAYEGVLPTTTHVVVSNWGSVLNPRELPGPFLDELIGWLRVRAPLLQVLSTQSRESSITTARLLDVAEQLGELVQLRPVLGLETSNDDVRNGVLRKRMPQEAVRQAFVHVGEAAREIGRTRVGLTVNLIAGCPGIEAGRIVDDLLESARFALNLAAAHAFDVDLNVSPYYTSRKGWEAFPTHPRCAFPALTEGVIAVAREIKRLEVTSRVFVDLEDQGDDQDRRSREMERDWVTDAFGTFNRTQRTDALERLLR